VLILVRVEGRSTSGHEEIPNAWLSVRGIKSRWCKRWRSVRSMKGDAFAFRSERSGAEAGFVVAREVGGSNVGG